MTPTERRRQYKQNIITVMGGKCSCCGYDKCNRALQLHHINPNDKAFEISSKTYFAWDKLETELKKCVLVCANCHAEIEDGIRNNPTESSFNQSIFNEFSIQIDQKKNGNICIDCGKKIDYRASRCIECSAKIRQITQRPNRDELKFLIRTLSFTAIGKQYNVSDNAVRKWCDSYNLPRKIKDIKSYSDEEWEKI